MKAMILAAGRGERMRPLTDTTPKPLLKIGNKRLIEYHIEALARAGVRDIVVNVSWLREQIVAALGDGSRWGVQIHISDEGAVALETAGGIFHALRQLGPHPFVVVNGDIWTDYSYSRLSLPADADAHLVLVPNPDFHPRGDFGFSEGRVQPDGPQRYTFSGIAMYRPEFFAGCAPGRFPLLPLLRRSIGAGALSGEIYAGTWNDIGTPARLEQLRASL